MKINFNATYVKIELIIVTKKITNFIVISFISVKLIIKQKCLIIATLRGDLFSISLSKASWFITHPTGSFYHLADLATHATLALDNSWHLRQ